MCCWQVGFLSLDPLALLLVVLLAVLLCYGTSESSYVNNGARSSLSALCSVPQASF